MTSAGQIRLRQARPCDVETLLPLVRAYHEFEQVSMSDRRRRAAIAPLLEPESNLGAVYLIEDARTCVGYVALCFGYSIEFAGRDAFIDELFVVAAARGRGIGTRVLSLIGEEAVTHGVAALHLEVARDNERARRVYAAAGFEDRQRFHLMSWRLDP
jgi:ribosomal protein S18 acetylase RimI-like enzyme